MSQMLPIVFELRTELDTVRRSVSHFSALLPIGDVTISTYLHLTVGTQADRLEEMVCPLPITNDPFVQRGSRWQQLQTGSLS